MFAIFGAYSTWTIMAALRSSASPAPADAPVSIGEDPLQSRLPMRWNLIAACFVGGLVLLSYGGSVASDGASHIALALGVPAAIVGVTIVAIGTTLPELVTGVTAVRKGQTDLAIGNALGSCLFNAGAIFGLTGLISPPIADKTLIVPLAYMGLLALALVPISRTFQKTVSRIEGGLLLASYAAFLVTTAVQTAGTR
jgi:cation:H+ antiporter